MSMFEDSISPSVPYIDGHGGPDARLTARAQRGAEKIKAMGHSGTITLESFLLAQGRMNRALQKQVNRLASEKQTLIHQLTRRERQLEKAHTYITDLKAKVRDLTPMGGGVEGE